MPTRKCETRVGDEVRRAIDIDAMIADPRVELLQRLSSRVNKVRLKTSALRRSIVGSSGLGRDDNALVLGGEDRNLVRAIGYGGEAVVSP